MHTHLVPSLRVGVTKLAALMGGGGWGTMNDVIGDTERVGGDAEGVVSGDSATVEAAMRSRLKCSVMACMSRAESFLQAEGGNAARIP